MARKTGKRPGSEAQATIMPVYDATALVGLRVNVLNSAIRRADANGEVTVEVPRIKEMMAAAAVARCLLPIKLRGHEMRAMRKIMRMTLAELANNLDSKTAVQTISRWESEAQPIGGYAEKVLRLLICETLRKRTPGVDYNGSMIANMRVIDPWMMQEDYEIPYLSLEMVKVRDAGHLVDAWDAQMSCYAYRESLATTEGA